MQVDNGTNIVMTVCDDLCFVTMSRKRSSLKVISMASSNILSNAQRCVSFMEAGLPGSRNLVAGKEDVVVAFLL